VSNDYAAAQAHYAQQRWAEAVAIYRHIVAEQPTALKAWALMGLCATQCGDLDTAADALQRAVELEPQAGNIHFRLGVVLFQQGHADRAAVAFRRAADLDPTNIDALQNLGAALVDLGHHAEAQPVFEAVLQRQADFELAWSGLANVYRALNNTAGMVHALERAVAINPDNPATRHLLQAARGLTPSRADADYVESFFDGYAARFDQHLVQRLGYKGPEVLRDLLAKEFPERVWADVLDLGCGTGLFGAAIIQRSAEAKVVGVDLSRNMIEAARARGIYAQLTKADVVDFVTVCADKFDLVAAADVLIYVGELSALFAGVAHCLRAGGVFAFTVEESQVENFVLDSSGRYAHSRGYLEAQAKKHMLAVRVMTTAPLRLDGQGFENGLFVVLQQLG
jgi:predicted TPR repeat methyltransferase